MTEQPTNEPETVHDEPEQPFKRHGDALDDVVHDTADGENE